MPAGTDMMFAADEDVTVDEGEENSELGERYDVTPMGLPIRGHLDAAKRFLKGDLFIGRGSRQRPLQKSRYCNNHKVSEYGRDVAIAMFREILLHDKS